MAPRKVDFALQVIQEATQLAEITDRLESLADVYVASGYAPSGSDPIIDDDIAGHDIDSALLGEFALLVAALLALMEGNVPTPGGYATTLAKIRQVR